MSHDQEILYAAAHGLYERGDYKEASALFTQLVLRDPFEEPYWRGLAASQQLGGDYAAALQAWSLTSLLAEQDPLPHFHAAECLLSLGDKEEALKALRAAEELLQEEEQFQLLRTKIQVLKEVH